MKKSNTSRFLLLFLLLSTFGRLNVFAGNGKLYVATDKEIYNFLESIQFQIFLLNEPNSNKTVYAELLDCKGNRLAKKMLPLTSGISWGNLKIPQADTAAFYILYCYVINKDIVENDCTKRIYIKHNDVAENSKGSIISFFTEGSTFVALMPNKLLINFKDEFGNPLTGNGKIIDSKNYGIASFAIDESGYATSVFKPDYGVSYFIVIKDRDGKEIRKELPPVARSGVNLSVTMDKDSITYSAYSLTDDKDLLNYKLDILLDGKAVYKSDIDFVLGFSVIQETITLKNLQAGFLTFRLTDTKNKLHVQRVFYNPSENRASVLLKITDTINKKTATVTIPGFVNGYSFLNILKKNSPGEPANKYFKDCVAQPVIFSNGGNELSLNDILIATDKQPPLPVTSPSNENPFLTLRGTAYNSEGKLLKNEKLNLIFLRRNLKKEYKVVTTDRNGNFEIGSLIFYDTVKVYYQLADNSDEKNDLRIDLKVSPDDHFTGNASNYLLFTCSDKIVQETEPGTKKENNINPADTSLKKGKTLKEVTVNTKKEKRKTDSQKFIDDNVAAQHNQTNLIRNEFDFIANPQVIDSRSIFEFLQGRFSLSIHISSNGKIRMNTTSGEGIGVYLDDMDVTSDLDMVTHLLVRDVALVRFYSLPFKPRQQSTGSKYGAPSGGGSGGDLMIYTRRGFTATEQVVKGLPKTVIMGYNEDDPVNNSPAANTTQCLYWKPNWIPQKEQTIFVGLPAEGTEKNVQLIIEGINQSQSPFTFTKSLIFN